MLSPWHQVLRLSHVLGTLLVLFGSIVGFNERSCGEEGSEYREEANLAFRLRQERFEHVQLSYEVVATHTAGAANKKILAHLALMQADPTQALNHQERIDRVLGSTKATFEFQQFTFSPDRLRFEHWRCDSVEAAKRAVDVVKPGEGDCYGWIYDKQKMMFFTPNRFDRGDEVATPHRQVSLSPPTVRIDAVEPFVMLLIHQGLGERVRNRFDLSKAEVSRVAGPGDAAFVCASTEKYDVWLDPAREYLPVRVEMKNALRGAGPVVRMDVLYEKRQGEGYVPSEMICVTFLGPNEVDLVEVFRLAGHKSGEQLDDPALYQFDLLDGTEVRGSEKDGKGNGIYWKGRVVPIDPFQAFSKELESVKSRDRGE